MLIINKKTRLNTYSNSNSIIPVKSQNFSSLYNKLKICNSVMYGLRHPITLNKYFNINHLPNFCMLYEGSGLGQIINTIFVAIMQHKSEENEAKPLRMYGLEIIFCAGSVCLRYGRKILSLGRTFGEVLPHFLHFYVA